MDSFIRFIDSFPLRDIQQMHIIAWLNEREKHRGKPLSGATKKVGLIVISSFYKHLNDNGYNSPNPAKSALKKLPKSSSKKYKPLTIEEVKKIVQYTV